jgi:hypothetical protein
MSKLLPVGGCHLLLLLDAPVSVSEAHRCHNHSEGSEDDVENAQVTIGERILPDFPEAFTKKP